MRPLVSLEAWALCVLAHSTKIYIYYAYSLRNDWLVQRILIPPNAAGYGRLCFSRWQPMVLVRSMMLSDFVLAGLPTHSQNWIALVLKSVESWNICQVWTSCIKDNCIFAKSLPRDISLTVKRWILVSYCWIFRRRKQDQLWVRQQEKGTIM